MFNFPLLSLPFISSPMGSYQFAGGELTEIVIHILIQLAVILFVAKLSGELAVSYTHLTLPTKA